ncbi:hypothetical protein BJX63DRAFT_415043 [Aspergillus granulosus]|uniref:Uncharacterized protein n=1 Tax=Aspergillus granulosus TaxID=176169 RepID=A0ABR4GTR2_9EURO
MGQGQESWSSGIGLQSLTRAKPALALGAFNHTTPAMGESHGDKASRVTGCRGISLLEVDQGIIPCHGPIYCRPSTSMEEDEDHNYNWSSSPDYIFCDRGWGGEHERLARVCTGDSYIHGLQLR